MNPLKERTALFATPQFQVLHKPTNELHRINVYYPQTGQVEIGGQMVIDWNNWVLVARKRIEMTDEEKEEYIRLFDEEEPFSYLSSPAEPAFKAGLFLRDIGVYPLHQDHFKKQWVCSLSDLKANVLTNNNSRLLTP